MGGFAEVWTCWEHNMHRAKWWVVKKNGELNIDSSGSWEAEIALFGKLEVSRWCKDARGCLGASGEELLIMCVGLHSLHRITATCRQTGQPCTLQCSVIFPPNAEHALLSMHIHQLRTYILAVATQTLYTQCYQHLHCNPNKEEGLYPTLRPAFQHRNYIIVTKKTPPASRSIVKQRRQRNIDSCTQRNKQVLLKVREKVGMSQILKEKGNAI